MGRRNTPAFLTLPDDESEPNDSNTMPKSKTKPSPKAGSKQKPATKSCCGGGKCRSADPSTDATKARVKEVIDGVFQNFLSDLRHHEGPFGETGQPPRGGPIPEGLGDFLANKLGARVIPQSEYKDHPGLLKYLAEATAAVKAAFPDVDIKPRIISVPMTARASRFAEDELPVEEPRKSDQQESVERLGRFCQFLRQIGLDGEEINEMMPMAKMAFGVTGVTPEPDVHKEEETELGKFITFLREEFGMSEEDIRTMPEWVRNQFSDAPTAATPSADSGKEDGDCPMCEADRKSTRLNSSH